MMKTIALLLIIFVLIINKTEAQTYDFRKSNWSMDSTQVQKSETAKLILSNNNNIIYKGKIGNWNAEILYAFTESNQLYHGAYILNLDNKNPQEDVNTFMVLEESLSKKYKNPYVKIAKTINGKVISQDEWASNLISDNMSISTKWKTNKTNIVLSLYSINDKPYIQIDYTSLEIEKKNKEERMKHLMDEL